jgi:CxxC motif-containing protein (DUF1111 family)
MRFVRACMLASIASVGMGLVCLCGSALADDNNQQVQDPGVRGGPAGAGGPLPGLSTTPAGFSEADFFNGARQVFQEIDSVSGTIGGEPGVGLGPRFNLNQCSGCHAQPAVGGTSPGITPNTPFAVNPQVAVATLDGATNVVPSFITANGPVREARFVKNPDGTADGGVHDLFTITGRTDATNQPNANTRTNTTCNIAQPDFKTQLAANNVIFRIPTPTFGAGQIENTPDSNLQATVAASASFAASLGISPFFNRSGNDGTITRFGWKAQNKSLLIFSGEAYNVEQGVTNENFGNEREGNLNCQFNPTPEDTTNLTPRTPSTGSAAADFSSDIVNFAAFMRLSAGPTPAPNAFPNTAHGFDVFKFVGCSACHAVQQTTAASPFTNQSLVKFQPFSDIAVHQMGVGLADNVSQGNADGDDFRSAPLWGVGKRIFFLHDGRTKDLLEAIRQHASQGSEANEVIEEFFELSNQDQQAVLNFLRSL